jgi:hypothetical protein
MTVLSGATGAVFGLGSGVVYWGDFGGGHEQRRLLGLDAGLLAGTVAGLVVGALWCWLMIRASDAARRRLASGKLIAAPLAGGVVAGAVATVLLHVAMQLVYDYPSGIWPHLWGQFFGIPAGGIVGALGVLAWSPVPEGAPRP